MMRTRFAVGLAVADLAVFIASLFLDPNPDFGAGLLFVAGIASFVGVGALLVSRIPTNPIGGLLLAAGTASVAATLVGTYADLGTIQVPPWPGSQQARTIGDALFVYPILIALVLVPLVFPDGRLPSPRFRWVVAITFAGMAAWGLGAVFAMQGADIVVLIATPVSFGGAVTAVTLRFRRGDPVQRQQIKWFATIVILAAIVIPLGAFFSNDYKDLASFFISVGILALFALPVVIGIAILRYRLYEIDRIISRTVSWAVVTGMLVAVFGGAVIALQAALAGFTGQGQTLAVAGSTLLAFALFQPIRQRVQRVVDRRFNRGRYDAERTTAAFAERLRDVVDLPTLATDLDATVRSAIAPSSIGLWLRGGGG
jgi:hypothetical protein